MCSIEEAIHITVHCNDKHGDPMGVADQFTFDIGDDVCALEIEFCEWVNFQIYKTNCVLIGEKDFPILTYGEWVGTMAHNGIVVTREVAADICNYLRELDGDVEHGWINLFHKFEEKEPFTVQDFTVTVEE